jgi:hypothetical protein
MHVKIKSQRGSSMLKISFVTIVSEDVDCKSMPRFMANTLLPTCNSGVIWSHKTCTEVGDVYYIKTCQCHLQKLNC